MIKYLFYDDDVKQDPTDEVKILVDGWNKLYRIQKDNNCGEFIDPINKDGSERSDFPYYPLYAYAESCYYEKDYEKLSDKILTKIIEKYDLDCVCYKDTIYIAEDTVVDLEEAVYKELKIKSIDYDE